MGGVKLYLNLQTLQAHNSHTKFKILLIIYGFANHMLRRSSTEDQMKIDATTFAEELCAITFTVYTRIQKTTPDIIAEMFFKRGLTNIQSAICNCFNV
jgi:ribosomal protein S3AE